MGFDETRWTGPVDNITDPSALQTTVTFSEHGMFNFYLEGYLDGEIIDWDDVLITVSPRENQPPVIEIINNIVFQLPDPDIASSISGNLWAEVTDEITTTEEDPCAICEYATWEWINSADLPSGTRPPFGEDPVSDTATDTLTPRVEFDTPGHYVITLTVTDPSDDKIRLFMSNFGN